MGPIDMSHDPRAIANYYLEKAWAEGRELTPIKVMKLTYIAHGWHLALHERPLINEQVEAWQFGPVIRSVYDAFKRFGCDPIEEPAMNALNKRRHFFGTPLPNDVITATFDDEELGTMESVWSEYGWRPEIQLAHLTNHIGTPWSDTYDRHSRNKPISNNRMLQYYQELANKNCLQAA